MRNAHLPCICCWVKPWIRGGKSHALRSKLCKCVNIYLSFCTPLSCLSLFCFGTFENMGYLYSSSFFSSCFFGLASFLFIYFFLSCSLVWKYFLHSPYFSFYQNLEREVHNTSDGVFILVDGIACFCVTLSVKVNILFVGVCEFRSWEYETSLNIDIRAWQNSTQSKRLCVRFISRSNVYGFGRNLFYHWGACYCIFLVFKINPKSIARENKFHIILLYHIFQLLRVKGGPYWQIAHKL
jgi:hypothetical protein